MMGGVVDVLGAHAFCTTLMSPGNDSFSVRTSCVSRFWADLTAVWQAFSVAQEPFGAAPPELGRVVGAAVPVGAVVLVGGVAGGVDVP